MSEVCEAPPVAAQAPVVIYCDLCTEEDRRPAQKTCIRCEMSMCAQHLQDHLTIPALKKHPLSKPIAPREGVTECPRHGKLLEYYCLDDLTVACVSCAIEDKHHHHNMKTFPTAHKELDEKLRDAQKALVKTQQESLDLETWEKEERERLSHSSVRVLEAVSKLRDLALTRVQSSVSARMVSIRTGKNGAQAALSEADSFSFLQGFAGVHQAVEKARAVSLMKGLEPGEDRDKLVLEVRQSGSKVLEQVGELWGSLLAFVDPENHRDAESPTGASDGTTELTFDPKTLGQGMSLSKDLRKVFYHSPSPLGECGPHTLLCQMTSSNVVKHSQWVIKLSEDCDWMIGLCDQTYAQIYKNQRFGDLNNVYVYALCWQDNQLSSLSTQYYEQTVFTAETSPWSSSKIEHRVRPQVAKVSGLKGVDDIPRPDYVEVVWDITSSSLSFYSMGQHYQRTELHRVQIEASGLTPFVTVGRVDASTRQPKQPEQNWSCPCGQVHPRHQHRFNGPQQVTCSCGRVEGTAYTQVICKLV